MQSTHALARGDGGLLDSVPHVPFLRADHTYVFALPSDVEGPISLQDDDNHTLDELRLGTTHEANDAAAASSSFHVTTFANLSDGLAPSLVLRLGAHALRVGVASATSQAGGVASVRVGAHRLRLAMFCHWDVGSESRRALDMRVRAPDTTLWRSAEVLFPNTSDGAVARVDLRLSTLRCALAADPTPHARLSARVFVDGDRDAGLVLGIFCLDGGADSVGASGIVGDVVFDEAVDLARLRIHPGSRRSAFLPAAKNQPVSRAVSQAAPSARTMAVCDSDGLVRLYGGVDVGRIRSVDLALNPNAARGRTAGLEANGGGGVQLLGNATAVRVDVADEAFATGEAPLFVWQCSGGACANDSLVNMSASVTVPFYPCQAMLDASSIHACATRSGRAVVRECKLVIVPFTGQRLDTLNPDYAPFAGDDAPGSAVLLTILIASIVVAAIALALSVTGCWAGWWRIGAFGGASKDSDDPSAPPPSPKRAPQAVESRGALPSLHDLALPVRHRPSRRRRRARFR